MRGTSSQLACAGSVLKFGEEHQIGWWPSRFHEPPVVTRGRYERVVVFGIVFGTGTVWWLLTRKDKTEVAKDWHFWTKLVSDGLS